MPRLEQKLPAQVLSVAEVKRILAQPRASDAIGIRDRAMLEVLYATAVRRSELVRLSIYAIDPERRVTHVRLGKGKKDRVVPISERAVKAVECYLTEARPKLVTSDTEVLFLSAEGQPLSPDHLTYIVKQHIEAAGIHRPGSCHTLRHAAATHMLEGGADVRFVQELLGHAKVTTTQVYTHVAITKLIEVYGKTHPSAQSERKPTTRPDEAVLKDELLEDLAAEEDEEAPGCPSEEEQG
jgi:integrase/recombinase XerD